MNDVQESNKIIDVTGGIVWTSGLLIGGLSLAWHVTHYFHPRADTFGHFMGSAGLSVLFLFGLGMVFFCWVPWPYYGEKWKEQEKAKEAQEVRDKLDKLDKLAEARRKHRK